jgi:hypothetical protein
MARVVLDVSPDTMLYAKTHGAKYDALNRQWYVEGEVPPELVNLVPHIANPIFEEVAPACPKCQASTVKRRNGKTGAYFWGCSRYRSDGLGCKGYIDYEEWLAKQLEDKPGRVTDYLEQKGALPKMSPSEPVQAKAATSGDDQRVLRWAQITELASRECGGAAQASRWLNTPKIALKGKTPIEAMTTDAGCNQVEKLLRELNT